jgi:hypothetical protein
MQFLESFGHWIAFSNRFGLMSADAFLSIIISLSGWLGRGRYLAHDWNLSSRGWSQRNAPSKAGTDRCGRGGDDPGEAATAAPLPLSPCRGGASAPNSMSCDDTSRSSSISCGGWRTTPQSVPSSFPVAATKNILVSGRPRPSSFPVMHVAASSGLNIDRLRPAPDLDLDRRRAPRLSSSHGGSMDTTGVHMRVVVQDNCRASAFPPWRMFLPL